MFEWFLNNMDIMANVIEIAMFVVTIFIWIQTSEINRSVRLENRRQKKVVSLRLINGDNTYDLPAKLRGSDVSRAEILGRIGMIPIDSDNKLVGRGFEITYTSTVGFINRINEILETTNDTTFEIPCKDKEYLQFELSNKTEVSSE